MGAVTLFAMGGTISMSGLDRLDGAALTAAVPGLETLSAPLEIRDLEPIGSGSLTFERVLSVAADAAEAVRAGAPGVVITQGTDTLEETAYLLDLVWAEDAPLVVTGAMRNPTLAGHDGPANLLAAARVAESPAARGLGVLVAFSDEIHAARFVRKTHSTSTATFASPDAGPIGHLVEGRVRLLTVPPRQPPLPPPTASARVALYTVTLDDDPATLAALAAGQDGLVVAGFGVGHVPAVLVETLGELAARMPVVLTSCTGAGSVLRGTYHAPGSEIELLGRGLIDGGFVHPYKARVLLKVLLGNAATREQVAAAFELR
ncbi:asparaginase [Streptacidiphilus jiangxiensis]|uniref:L-asparaginase n=1 Tax=Streptacidiphilus jiangxiensis TaxID=235985 RepID=A0A1H7U5W1_STRJI|nr:asparaginase [Streptacidiphilus jiangxiensis]SEL92363.1 L-asparaginase [Streptacidiphilus jiangxiensis]